MNKVGIYIRVLSEEQARIQAAGLGFLIRKSLMLFRKDLRPTVDALSRTNGKPTLTRSQGLSNVVSVVWPLIEN
jgi:hypothetical protein